MSGVFNRYNNLNTPVEIARHQICRANEVDAIGRRVVKALPMDDVAVAETIDPAVFEITAENAPNPNRLRQPCDTSAEATDSTN